MRYVRFQAGDQVLSGIMEDEAIWAIEGNFFDRYGLNGERYSPADVKFLAPCTPSKVVAVGLNYRDHIEEFDRAHIPEQPVLFVKLHHTVIGPDDVIVIPSGATRVDYEAELAVVMRKTCYRLDPDSAADCILGATCLNDVTERDMQRADGQWFRAKNFETFCPIGPYIVDGTDFDNRDIKLLLNGEVRQHSNTAHLIWSVPRLVSFISQVVPLYPGDIVTTGTPSGVGPLQKGDVVEVVIEGIGRLRNTVRGS
jgi:2-keto-4-pentenoate hydratase/2-oxohepta-3-ene-1,7-dioic acid hydratase in catechol pathway